MLFRRVKEKHGEIECAYVDQARHKDGKIGRGKKEIRDEGYRVAALDLPCWPQIKFMLRKELDSALWDTLICMTCYGHPTSVSKL